MFIKSFDLKTVASTITLASLLVAGLDFNFAPANSLEDDISSEINATGIISPSLWKTNMTLGQTVTLDRSITVNVEDIVETITKSTAPDKLDILFLADNTDSMGDAIANVKANATSLLNSLDTTYDDLQVGVARYYGDPKEVAYSSKNTGVETSFSKTYTYLNESKTCISGQGEAYPCYKYQVDYTEGGVEKHWTSFINESRYLQYGDVFTNSGTKNIYESTKGELGAEKAYQLQTSVNNDLGVAIEAINEWETGSGDDWAEGNFFALHQAATNGSDIGGYATDYITNWRSDAKKVIVWFGDAQSHVQTVNQEQTIAALKAQDISVIAIHTKSTPKSETDGLNKDLQASTVANSTSGAFADVYSSELSQTIESLIGQTVMETITTSPGINLNFASQGDTAGLDIAYSCIDSQGCNNVKDGETRQFQMQVTAQSTGIYDFQTVETATNARASNKITTVFPD